MDYSKKNFINNIGILSILLLITFVLLCSSWSSSKPSLAFSLLQKRPPRPTSSSPDVTIPKDELEEALTNASLVDEEDKTVIITIVNKAYVEPHNDQYPTMFDLFLEGFWVGGNETRSLLDKLLVVAMDQTAYERCKFRRLNCYKLVTDGVDFAEEKLYMSADFIKMMWSRTLFLLDVLKRGYNFIFTDTDVLWLRNPFPKLNLINSTDDFQISTDKFNGNPRSQSNLINTGFYHIRSNNKTISLFNTWYDARKNSSGLKEQDVLANLIREGVINQLGLEVRFLDTLYFSGFCSNSKDAGVVCTVHANCCRTITAKVADLTTVLKDWKRFRHSMATVTITNVTGSSNVSTNTDSNARNEFQWSRHISCEHSWAKP